MRCQVDQGFNYFHNLHIERGTALGRGRGRVGAHGPAKRTDTQGPIQAGQGAGGPPSPQQTQSRQQNAQVFPLMHWRSM